MNNWSEPVYLDAEKKYAGCFVVYLDGKYGV